MQKQVENRLFGLADASSSITARIRNTTTNNVISSETFTNGTEHKYQFTPNGNVQIEWYTSPNQTFSIDNVEVIERGDEILADVRTYQDFYPFGQLSRKYNSPNYSRGFNGQIKTDEIAGEGNHTTARYWEYDTRLGRRWNIDPKPNHSISGYGTFSNNPVLYSDVLGDSVDIDTQELYRKDDEGNYVNYEQAVAFENYLASDEGREYVLNKAEQGFEFTGEITGVHLSADEAGANSVDVNVTFKVGDTHGNRGLTNFTIKNNVLSMTHLVTNNINNFGPLKDFGSKTINLGSYNTWRHETFLHGEFIYNKYREGLSKDQIYSKYGRQHSLSIFNNSSYKRNGLKILNQYNLNIGAGHSRDFVWYNIMLTGLDYYYRDDISK